MNLTMGRWKIFSKISSKFRRSKRSSAPVHGPSSQNVTPCASVRETPHASDDIVTSHASDNIVTSHASDDIQSAGSHPSAPLARHSQSTPPVGVLSSSQPYVDVQAVMQNHTPSIARSDAPSSSTSAVPSSSTPSSSVLRESDYTERITGADDPVDPGNVNADLDDLKERDHTKQIRRAADAVGRPNEQVDLDNLSNYISQYLAFIKHGREKPSRACDSPGSKSLMKLKDVISGAAQIAKDWCPDAKTIAQKALQGVGELHILATGFLVLGDIMERFETISSNREECLCLLERMNNLIQDVKQLRERPGLKEAMEAKIKEAIELIIEVSLACCTQIDRPKYKKLFSTTVNTKELQGFQTRLTELHRKIQLQMEFGLHDLLLRVPPCPRASEEFRRENRVQIEKVTELLKWESEERAVAVILYGLGGTGKTALGDAVYWSLYHEKVLPYRNHEEGLECKYSYVRLFDFITSVPDIPKLQTQVLQDLRSRIPEIRRYEDGRNEIGSILEKEVVFIYIDNVLFPDKVEQGLDAIEQLLPRTTEKVIKLRLLITTPDKGAAVKACNKLRIKTELYPIETLEDTKAMQLVKEELNAGEEDLVNEQLNGRDAKLDSNQINQIVQICGGIPMLLIEVANHIGSSQTREEAQERYQEVISETENNWNGHKGWTIARYAFAHEYLDEHLKDPFFDICLYFQGWHWEELSNIVGKSQLNSLENRALVTKDVNSMTAKLHNVILAIGIHNKGRRFKFSSASEFQEVLNPTKDEDLRGIKGIWSNDNIGPLDIPASKLDLMCGSLRVLALQNSTKVSDRCNRTFEELFFFSAEISHIPFDLSKVKKLRHLCYSPDDFHNLCQMPPNLISTLRILQLRQRGSIESLPECIGQFNFLDSIDLSLTDLKKLPDGFCSLSSLKTLAMDNCRSLEKLPDGFGEVRSLRKLSLSGCVSLEVLPDSFSQLNFLEDLNLSGCVKLVRLCADFKELSSLRVLSLKDCKMLQNLPENFHGLPSLKHLYLSKCVQLEVRSMESIVKMETLQIVDIQGSPLLHQAWQTIEEVCIQWSHIVRTSGQGSSTEEIMECNDDMQE